MHGGGAQHVLDVFAFERGEGEEEDRVVGETLVECGRAKE